jgi:hypothetical protein
VAINHAVWYREKMTASLASALLVIVGSAFYGLLFFLIGNEELRKTWTCQIE